MARVHVVMKQCQNRIARFAVLPHEIYSTKKEAWDRADELNSKSITNLYWVETAPFLKSLSEDNSEDSND
jgi:hypothetical protein